MKYYRYKATNLITVKDLITIEFLNLSKSYEFPEEFHNFWEMVYVDKNSIIYTMDDVPFTVCEGELLFISPNQKHSIHANGSKDSSIFVLCFDSTSPIMQFFSGYKSKLDKKSKHFIEDIMNETQHTFSLPFKEKLSLLPNPNLGGQQAILLDLELLLIHLLRLEQNRETRSLEFIKDESFAQDLSTRMIEFLNAKVYGTVSLQELCNNFNYSKTYLCQAFKQINGDSIINYFNKLKIAEAKKLIKETNLSFSQISDLLQFSDPRYFHLLFKKTTHVTPKQYRNSILSDF